MQSPSAREPCWSTRVTTLLDFLTTSFEVRLPSQNYTSYRVYEFILECLPEASKVNLFKNMLITSCRP